MIRTDDGLKATRDAASHLEDALLDLQRSRSRYHPKTFELLARPILEELQLRRREIDDYLGVVFPTTTASYDLQSLTVN